MAPHWGPQHSLMGSPHPLSPDPGVPVLSPQCPCPPAHRRGMLFLCSPVPGRSRQHSPGQSLPRVPSGSGVPQPPQGVAAGLGGHGGDIPSLGCQSGTCGCGKGGRRAGWQRGDTGEGSTALMLRGLGWVCLASDAPSTAHTLGGVVRWFRWSRSVTAGEAPRGRCPPALCRPRTRRATGMTP